jgi:hypothetical protein
MNDAINKVFIGFAKRAEKVDRESLVESFVNVGPLLNVLSTIDNQILYGRRGTGKTHALVYLAETVKRNGDIPVYLDLRHIGSTGGIYSDQQISTSERATRLLMDTLAALHDELLGVAIEGEFGLDLSTFGSILDEFADAISEVHVRGQTEEEQTLVDESAQSSSIKLGIRGSFSSLSANIEGGSDESTKSTDSLRIRNFGVPEYRVHFGRVGNVLQRLSQMLGKRRIWILLDEWSVIPADLQPYLADLLRRSVFPVTAISVKIAAIEKRSSFLKRLPGGDYIGIELGGDASADLNLDDFMVFDNDEQKAVAFYRSLLFQHFRASSGQNIASAASIGSPEQLTRSAFTQDNVFREFVRAAEGIPRDAFSILSLAAQQSSGSAISMDALRKSSKTWYQRDKETAVTANTAALRLLHWIIDEVIAHRHSRAFLLERSQSNSLIDSLFDARVIHLLKRNISAHDQPGVRYDVYKIDYGCYVDLLSTNRSPQGLLPFDDSRFVDVPSDDYRAIRRAILNLSEFEKNR